MPALRNSAGVVVGACDSIPMFEQGVRQWGPWSRAQRTPTAAADINVEIDAPKMQDALGPWYKRLP